MHQFPRRKLRRIPSQGMLRGVCAGIADYVNLPIVAVRLIAILLLFCGLFLPIIVVYLVLGYTLETKPHAEGDSYCRESNDLLLTQTEARFKSNEERLRRIEAYITSERFALRNDFRQL